MEKWTDKKAWWMDLLKSGIAFTLGAIITVVIINRIEENRTEQRSNSALTISCDSRRWRIFEKIL
jgi:hypothetical protein